MDSFNDQVVEAARALAGAQALLIGAGAGMGVDSGLPDFRGREGFWRAYPPFARLGLGLSEVASPRWFRDDPAMAWGFYGHRLNLYRATTPHGGFDTLLRWARQMPQGAFVFTSNVDGQFQKAGFDPDRLAECHGSIHHLQCFAGCGQPIFPSPPGEIVVDPVTFRAPGPWPACPRCGGIARPAILMFGDFGWDSTLTDLQFERLERWLDQLNGAPLAVVELGAGKAIPTVRSFCEQVARRFQGRLIRINPRDPDVPPGQVSLALGALQGLQRIEKERCLLG